MAQAAFRNHGSCNDDLWITELSSTLGLDRLLFDQSQPFHPNETGHHHYAVAFNTFVIRNVK